MEGRPLDDTNIVECARRGDIAAYESLVQSYQDLAFRAAYLITADAADAEDAAQTAFIKAFYALPTFRPGSPFRPWLLRIVTNEARNRRKLAGRRARLTLHLAEGALRVNAAPSAEDAAFRREQSERLFAAVAELPERERLAVLYRYFLDLSEAEIARALECRPGTVKSRLSRGLARLRTSLGQEANREP